MNLLQRFIKFYSIVTTSVLIREVRAFTIRCELSRISLLYLLWGHVGSRSRRRTNVHEHCYWSHAYTTELTCLVLFPFICYAMQRVCALLLLLLCGCCVLQATTCCLAHGRLSTLQDARSCGVPAASWLQCAARRCCGWMCRAVVLTALLSVRAWSFVLCIDCVRSVRVFFGHATLWFWAKKNEEVFGFFFMAIFYFALNFWKYFVWQLGINMPSEEGIRHRCWFALWPLFVSVLQAWRVYVMLLLYVGRN